MSASVISDKTGIWYVSMCCQDRVDLIYYIRLHESNYKQLAKVSKIPGKKYSVRYEEQEFYGISTEDLHTALHSSSKETFFGYLGKGSLSKVDKAAMLKFTPDMSLGKIRMKYTIIEDIESKMDTNAGKSEMDQDFEYDPLSGIDHIDKVCEVSARAFAATVTIGTSEVGLCGFKMVVENCKASASAVAIAVAGFLWAQPAEPSFTIG